MSRTPFFIVLWFLYTSFPFLHGQESMSFSSLTKLNGLSNNTINDIRQDSSGYLWIATNKGLNRYDGLAFKTYQSNNADILQSDYILCLAIDSKNRLWFGTSDGSLYYLNIIEDKIYSVAEGLLRVNTIFERADGRFWIGAASGLHLLEQNNSGQFKLQQFSDLNVLAIKHANETLWLGTSTGVYYLDNRNQQTTPFAKEELGKELVFDIEFNHEQELWIATRHHGVFIYDLAKEQLLNIEEKLNNSTSVDFKDARKILKGTDDKLYIGTDGAGLIIYNNSSKELSHFTNSSNSILSNTIFSIYEDRDKNIWLGHIRKGISILNNDKDEVSVFFREYLSDEYSAILSIYEEENGDILCGTDGKGLFRIKKKTNKCEQVDKFLILENAYVQSIFRDSRNQLWIGTFSKGVFVQSPTSRLQELNSKAIDVRGFCEDDYGNIWIATNGQGLFKHHPDGRITAYKHQPNNSHSISSDYILSLSFYNSLRRF